MGFVPAKALVLIHLSVLLLSCLTVFANESDILGWSLLSNHQAPSPSYSPAEAPKHPSAHPPSHHHHHQHQHHKGHPPSQAPAHSPAKPPSQSPTQPPSYHLPTRSFVAVQGVVYCKSCKFVGIDTVLGASPVVGAVVRLQCNNTKYPTVQEAKTDKNGYFFIMAPKNITTYGSHKCKVFLVSSPLATCQIPTDLHAGRKGAILMPQMKPRVPPLPFELFTVGPFAFEPSPKDKCNLP